MHGAGDSATADGRTCPTMCYGTSLEHRAATSEHWAGMLRSRFPGRAPQQRQHVVRRPPLAERPEMQTSTFRCTELVRPIKESVSAEQIVP